MEPLFTDYFERVQALHRDFIATFKGLPAEALDWIPGDEMNSFCILVVHVTAATRYWIGDVGLGEPSNRNRDAEFQAKGLSAAELQARFASVEDYVRAGLERLTLADLAVMRSATGRDTQVSGGWALLHALQHTGLHLGHAQITRQLWQQRG
jgi:uncharacterized damage-inducible protein DinB